MNEIADIYDYEAGKLIKRLIEFLGENNVKRCLRRHEQALKSAGPIFGEYYLKRRHPWLSAFKQYYGLTNRARSIHRHMTPELKALVIDAKKVVTLLKNMSDSVKNKYKRDFMDMDNARNYLFEIKIAWHFFVKGYGIKWYEEDSIKHPEFLVTAPDLKFDVECKWISVDIARRIHRKDFYGFADRLTPEIEKREYTGRIDIVLDDKLYGSTIRSLCFKVLELVDGGELKGEYQISPFGTLVLDLNYVSSVVIDMKERMKKLCERKANEAHGEIFARSKDGKPVDPIELTVMSEKADKVLYRIEDKISNAEEQLDKSKPGLIVCFLEGVNGFELQKLGSESGLQLTTKDVLLKDKFSHVVGIGYSSESMAEKRDSSEEIFGPALFFRNHNCKFEEAKTFTFVSPPRF